MKIINKYFLRQLTTIFIMLLLVLTGLAWMLQIMSMLKFLISYGVNFGGFVGLTMLMLPFIISIIIPFVTFIAIIFVYNKMISDNELTVMAASGLSPKQLARPALKLALVLTIIHWLLNIFLVPATQSKFYDTQWELRYGLAHMKLQESGFNNLTEGLVVYVEKVSGYDLSQLMLSDNRNEKNEITIFAEKGKLVATNRGLSIMMSNGSLQSKSDTLTTGTFDTFDMDMNVADKNDEAAFRVRCIRTSQLFRIMFTQENEYQHKLVMAEICNRLLGPLMNLILAGICLAVLLRASLLRRRASAAPIIAVGLMAVSMALFMSASNMIYNLTNLGILALVQGLALIGIMAILFKK